MSVSTAMINGSIDEGKNIVITTEPGIGTVGDTMAALEASPYSVGVIHVGFSGGEAFGLPYFDGEEVKMEVPEKIQNSQVLVLDGIEFMDNIDRKRITELLTYRTLHGNILPNLKAIVAISVGNEHNDAFTFGQIGNTVTIHAR